MPSSVSSWSRTRNGRILISSGGSDYPYNLVKAAGVDLATAQPYEAVAKRMNRIMDEIEAILARRK